MQTKIPTEAQLQKLYKKSACTMVGYIPTELPLYIEELKAHGFLNEKFTVYETITEELSRTFDVEVSSGVNVFIIDLDDMQNIPAFSVGLRFNRGYRWLDDIIDNWKRES